MTEHTPGPWVTSCLSNGSEWTVCVDGGDMVADLSQTDNSEANAAFIATAPDMLAFIKQVAEGAAVEGCWLSEDGEVIDGFDTEDDAPPEDEWPGATWEPCTEYEQAQYLSSLAEQARALVAKAEGRADS